jgi:hypothetical protein
MKFLSCVLVWAVCAIGYGQNVPQSTTTKSAVAPKVAAAPVASQRASGYWYQARNGRWYWATGARTAAAPVAAPAAPKATAQPQPSARLASAPPSVRYSYDPSQPNSEQLRLLQQEVARLRRSMEELRAPQTPRNNFMLEDWWTRQQHGEANSDPNLFQ